MQKLSDLEYLKLSKMQALWYNVKMFFCAIPSWLKKLFLGIVNFFVKCGVSVKDEFVDIFTTFTKGNWAVKTSFLIFGFGNMYYGQFLRGLLFLLFEIVFVGYMFVPSGGFYWLGKGNWFQLGATVGDVQGGFKETVTEVFGMQVVTKDWVAGDDSVKVMQIRHCLTCRRQV